jgi:dTDP-4-amino-4,6-dideoxygalactose transaminase
MADLALQYGGIKDELEKAAITVLRSGSYILGENVKALEAEFAQYCGAQHAIGVNSGTDALWLSLQALDIKPDDEVIVPAFTIMADASVVCQLKARPVFADINPSTFNIDPKDLSKKITKRTKAIIVVDLYGQTVDIEPIIAIAKRYDIAVVEDACQAIGAMYKERKAGTLADIGCFSFYPTKNLGAFGDGGMVTTNDKTLADKIRLLRHHGDAGQYNNIIIGHNSRLDEIQAAILRVKFQHLDAWNQARRNNAKSYNSALGGISGLITPREQNGCYHIYHQYVIRTHKRDELRRHLKESGITTLVYYPIPLHLQKALGYLGYSQGDFPQSESACQEVLAIPVYAELEPTKRNYVIKQIQSFFKSKYHVS